MYSQKECVFNAIEAFMAENGRTFEPGQKCELSSTDRSTIVQMLIACAAAGEVEVKSEGARSNMKKYFDGALSNWLRKDPRLNGSVKYVAKNPGSRQGAGDAMLKNLKLLLAKVKGTEHEAEVQEAIDARTQEIAATKIKHVEVDAEQAA